MPDLTPWTNPRGRNLRAGDRGFKGWSYDPILATGSTLAPNGLVFGHRIYHAGGSIKSLHFLTLNPMSGGVAGQNLAGIYSPAGALLAQSGDLTALYQAMSLGLVTVPLVASLPAGFYDVAVLFNSATLNPQMYRLQSQTAGALSAGANGLTSPRSWSANTAQTSLPATLGAKIERGVGEWLAIS